MRINENGTHSTTNLYDSFSRKYIGFDLGEEHEAEVEGDVRFGPVHLQLFDSTTQQSFNSLIIAISL